MKHVHSFNSFLNENKMKLNSTVLASTKDFTWVYQTGKDSIKTAIEINKKLNDLGIRSFISKTTGDTIAIPTKDLIIAFNKVLKNYNNLRQHGYDDGTKIDKNIVNEILERENKTGTGEIAVKKVNKTKVEGVMKSMNIEFENIGAKDSSSLNYFKLPNSSWSILNKISKKVKLESMTIDEKQ